jgi:hypothetical protein
VTTATRTTLLAALTRVVMGFPMRGQRVGMGGLCA